VIGWPRRLRPLRIHGPSTEIFLDPRHGAARFYPHREHGQWLSPDTYALTGEEAVDGLSVGGGVEPVLQAGQGDALAAAKLGLAQPAVLSLSNARYSYRPLHLPPCARERRDGRAQRGDSQAHRFDDGQCGE
jgi:hypothetical protein